jgi:hypothetical protein
VDAQLKLVADLTAGFRRLNVPGKALADVKISVELRDGGLLKSLNAGSQGRAGDVIIGIAKLAGTVLSGGMAMLASDGSKPEPTACVKAEGSCPQIAEKGCPLLIGSDVRSVRSVPGPPPPAWGGGRAAPPSACL